MNQWFNVNVLYKGHHWHKERKKSYLDVNILVETIHLIEQLK